MPTNLMIALKPDADPTPLIELGTMLSQPPSKIRLVTLVTVRTEDDERQRIALAEQQVAAAAAILTDAGYQTATEARVNAYSVGRELTHLAEEHDIDLLVIGLGKRSRVGKALLGSDAQTVLLTAPCPVACTRTD